MKTIPNPYMDNIKEYSQTVDNQKIEIEPLFEDKFNTKSFITGIYDEDLRMVKVRILRMFTSKLEVKSKDDLMVSIDLDIEYNSYAKTLLSPSVIKSEIRCFINIVKKAYEVGARIGVK